MRVLQRVWKDIRKGKNIDLYVTIVVAIALTALNLIGPAFQAHLAPITLGVLALLAITSLGNRYRVEELLRKHSHSLDDFYLEEYPASYKEDFEAAEELWLVGISLHRTIQNNYSAVERKLQQGHRVRVLLVHPEGPGIKMAVQRNYAYREVEPKSNDVRLTLQLLCNLRNVASGGLEIRTIQYPLAYGVTAVNPDTTSGILYLEHYCFRVSSDSWPRFVLRASDGRWYGFFRREARALWDAGVDWSCNSSQEAA
jgi:hypothetical protein